MNKDMKSLGYIVKVGKSYVQDVDYIIGEQPSFMMGSLNKHIKVFNSEKAAGFAKECNGKIMEIYAREVTGELERKIDHD